ncbi:hypothetical protein, partial [Nocardia cyriacigeorgica]|uniref:hypothetical protein n=1 Tax=Nocardia cyriacigeorgica TaxID=135487 RepID=UPI002455E691
MGWPGEREADDQRYGADAGHVRHRTEVCFEHPRAGPRGDFGGGGGGRGGGGGPRAPPPPPGEPRRGGGP